MRWTHLAWKSKWLERTFVIQKFASSGWNSIPSFSTLFSGYLWQTLWLDVLMILPLGRKAWWWFGFRADFMILWLIIVMFWSARLIILACQDCFSRNVSETSFCSSPPSRSRGTETKIGKPCVAEYVVCIHIFAYCLIIMMIARPLRGGWQRVWWVIDNNDPDPLDHRLEAEELSCFHPTVEGRLLIWPLFLLPKKAGCISNVLEDSGSQWGVCFSHTFPF